MFRVLSVVFILLVATDALALQDDDCSDSLRDALFELAPDAVLRIDEAAHGPSIVDETIAIVENEGVSTAVVIRGTELHVVSPDVPHAVARRWARQISREFSEDRSACGLAERIRATSAGRTSSRWGFALVSLLASLGTLLSGARLAQSDSPP